MTLTKEHKKALINDLNETIKKIDLQERILAENEKSEDMKCWHEMELFQLENQKRLIENSLINGEIDF